MPEDVRRGQLVARDEGGDTGRRIGEAPVHEASAGALAKLKNTGCDMRPRHAQCPGGACKLNGGVAWRKKLFRLRLNLRQALDPGLDRSADPCRVDCADNPGYGQTCEGVRPVKDRDRDPILCNGSDFGPQNLSVIENRQARGKLYFAHPMHEVRDQAFGITRFRRIGERRLDHLSKSRKHAVLTAWIMHCHLEE